MRVTSITIRRVAAAALAAPILALVGAGAAGAAPQQAAPASHQSVVTHGDGCGGYGDWGYGWRYNDRFHDDCGYGYGYGHGYGGYGGYGYGYDNGVVVVVL
ncbi:hypothetical protein [Actinacidiphila sp. bgisy160]|uniref:hypothetical protein n=1 Tax=Actinacidiphila sp. bgisy160 TaxID=3413796 RepID=UPI003D738954